MSANVILLKQSVDVCYRLVLHSVYPWINQKVFILVISFDNDVHFVMISFGSEVRKKLLNNDVHVRTYKEYNAFTYVCPYPMMH